MCPRAAAERSRVVSGEDGRASGGQNYTAPIEPRRFARVDERAPASAELVDARFDASEIDEQQPLLIAPPTAYGQDFQCEWPRLHGVPVLCCQDRISTSQFEKVSVQRADPRARWRVGLARMQFRIEKGRVGLRIGDALATAWVGEL